VFISTTRCFLSTSRDSDSTTSLGSPFQHLPTLSEKCLLMSNLNVPWCNLRPLPLILWLVCGRRGRSPPHHNLLSDTIPVPSSAPCKTCAPDSSQVLLPSSEYDPRPQCLSCREGPKTEQSTQDAISPVLSTDHFFAPDGNSISDASQDAIHLLCQLGTLLAHVHLSFDQHPQFCFFHTVFQPPCPRPVALPGVVVAEVQELALGLIELHPIGLSPLIPL